MDLSSGRHLTQTNKPASKTNTKGGGGGGGGGSEMATQWQNNYTNSNVRMKN